MGKPVLCHFFHFFLAIAGLLGNTINSHGDDASHAGVKAPLIFDKILLGF